MTVHKIRNAFYYTATDVWIQCMCGDVFYSWETWDGHKSLGER